MRKDRYEQMAGSLSCLRDGRPSVRLGLWLPGRGTGQEGVPQGAVNGVWPGIGGGDGLLDHAEGRARTGAKGPHGRGRREHVAGQQQFDRQGRGVMQGVRLARRLPLEAVVQVGHVAPNNKPKRWITGQYFGKLNTFRNDHWVFGDRDSGVCLVKFSWTAIRRHVPVKARHPAMTPPWPDTGPNGARRSKPE